MILDGWTTLALGTPNIRCEYAITHNLAGASLTLPSLDHLIHRGHRLRFESKSWRLMEGANSIVRYASGN